MEDTSHLKAYEADALNKLNDEDPGWTWSTNTMDKGGWMEMEEDDKIPQFYRYWRDLGGYVFPKGFPYQLPLDPMAPPLPFSKAPSSLHESFPQRSIVVTKAYEALFHRLLSLRWGRTLGAVVTGQPGTGKTIFLAFMLVRLILAKQVIVLCSSTSYKVLYQGSVYSRPASMGFGNLPKHHPSNRSLWTLIDLDYERRGPPMDATANIWPLQASSPEPDRWRDWAKQFKAAVIGMPQWTEEELLAILPLLPGYHVDAKKLCKALDLFEAGGKKIGPVLAHFKRKDDRELLGAVIEVLRTRREEEEQEEEQQEEEEGDGFGASIDEDYDLDALDVVSTTDEDKTVVPEWLLQKLVENATIEFGFAPRDVYDGIFLLAHTRRAHEVALKKIDYSTLKLLTQRFDDELELHGTTHRVVAVYPRLTNSTIKADAWTLDFKSPRIRKYAMDLMLLKGRRNRREMFDLFHELPASSSFAGWIFEAIVNQLFADGWELDSPDSPIPLPIRMTSNGRDPPSFTTQRPPSTIPQTPLRAIANTPVSVEFGPCVKLDNVTLDNGNYYIPAAMNNPLFDAFTINCVDETTALISIFQMTVSSRHKGSADGYLNVRKIVARVKNLLRRGQKVKCSVEVRYFLVCPKSNPRNRWEMPKNWGENCGNDDHRGLVFCLPIPTSDPA